MQKINITQCDALLAALKDAREYVEGRISKPHPVALPNLPKPARTDYRFDSRRKNKRVLAAIDAAIAGAEG